MYACLAPVRPSRAHRGIHEKVASGGSVGSGGLGAGRDGVDRSGGSWREQRAVQGVEASTRHHWASIERRRKRQRVSKGRTSKRTRRALEARVADRNVGPRVDAREQPDYGLRGCDDTDEYYAEYEHDTIWGDTVVASPFASGRHRMISHGMHS